MAPTRRPHGDPPPVYGVGIQYFSVQINHGGFFVGTGSSKRYDGGSFIWYDYVDIATWSPTMLENLVEDIGYEMYGRIKVFYCIPNLSMSKNGLREIRSDENTIQMSYFVSIGHQSFCLYLDHEDSMRDRNCNDGVNNPAPVTRSHKSTAKEQEECDDNGDEDDEDSDFEFRDSDYGISDGDDDLYADNVDEDEDTIKKTNVKCEHKIEGDGDSEQEDLWLPESDEEKVEFRFNSFKQEDMKDPKFKSGQVFENVEMLRKAIKEYI
uniref:Uncharacterized protein n=1 Tax=Avena sativa TaxID=4498 RepID=A0ACD5YQN7_AVESA